MSNQYAFVTPWRVEATCGEVADVLGDPLDLPRWWPAVYLQVEELRPPDPDGLGRIVRLHTNEANHRWAMGQGEQSLKLELARRRATSDAARSTIPAPPGPVTYAGVALVGGAVAVGASLACLMVGARRKNRPS